MRYVPTINVLYFRNWEWDMIPLIDSGRDDWIYITGSVLLLSFPSNKLGKYISQVLALLKYYIVTQQGCFLQGKKKLSHLLLLHKKK